jgi:hypothetical protein
VTIRPYKADDLFEIREQFWQQGTHQTYAEACALERGYAAYTAVSSISGRVLACAGIMEIWQGRGLCWASLDFEVRPLMPAIHKRMLAELDKSPFRRLEMYVAPGFIQGWEWAKRLGFELESRMQAASPDGRDLYVFKRVRHGSIYSTLSRRSSSDRLSR